MNERLWQTACHEAGHATLAVLLDLDLHRIELFADGSGHAVVPGRGELGDHDEAALISAGELGSLLLGPWPPEGVEAVDVSSLPEPDDDEQSQLEAAYYEERLNTIASTSAPTCAAALSARIGRETARQALDAIADRVREVAIRLYETGAVSGLDVCEIIERSDCDDEQGSPEFVP